MLKTCSACGTTEVQGGQTTNKAGVVGPGLAGQYSIIFTVGVTQAERAPVEVALNVNLNPIFVAQAKTNPALVCAGVKVTCCVRTFNLAEQAVLGTAANILVNVIRHVKASVAVEAGIYVTSAETDRRGLGRYAHGDGCGYACCKLCFVDAHKKYLRNSYWNNWLDLQCNRLCQPSI